MEAIVRVIALNIIHIHLFHGTGLVFFTVEEEAVVADDAARELLGVVENNAFKLAPVRQCRDIGKFREQGKNVVACLFWIGMGQCTNTGGT